MMNREPGHDRPARGLLWRFAAASLLAVAMGCVVANAAGVGVAAWGRNLAAWLLGAVLAAAISRRPLPASVAMAIATAAVAGLAATFLNADQDGVHRWWDLGPLHVNAAAILLPSAIVALARPASALIAAGASVAVTALLAAQPDASQATAFAAAMSIAIASRSDAPKARFAAVALLAAIAAIAWLQPDPLEPVPEVEEIVQLAWNVAPWAGVLGILGLIGAAAAPLMMRRPSPDALALSAYVAVVMLAPAVGAFPIPLMGMGMSPVLGLWLGIGLLAAPRR